MVSYLTKGEEIDGETKGEGRERRERTNKDTKEHTHTHTCALGYNSFAQTRKRTDAQKRGQRLFI